MIFRHRSQAYGKQWRWACRMLGLLLLFGFAGINESAAQKLLKGQVLDAGGLTPVHGATISLPQAQGWTATDSLGQFELPVPDQIWDSGTEITVRISALGYTETLLHWSPGEPALRILLERANKKLDPVSISGKSRYRSRGNPAVELIEKVIGNRAANRSANLPYLEYRSYEKIMMAVSDLPRLISDNPLFRNYNFIFENVDTSLVAGRELLPVYLEEKLKTEYRGSALGARKTIVDAARKTELDKRFVNNENIQAIVSHLHSDIDLYTNTILLLNRPFHSPVGAGAPLFYKYAIRDTVQLDGLDFILVEFVPKNVEDRLFSGKLWISTEGRYAIRRAELGIGHRSNVNWVNEVHIAFDFIRHSSGIYLPAGMETKINFGLYGSRQGMFSHWVLHYEGHNLEQSDPGIFQGQQITVLPEAGTRGKSFWDIQRPLELSEAEVTTYRNVDSLEQNKSFQRTLSWVSLAMTSFKHLGPLEIGPLEYMYSFNDLEGSRVRVGGRTTRQLSEKFYGETYGAYGFKDQQWKYYLGAAWTLNGQRIAEYPAHYLHLTYQNDVREPGHRPDFRNGDSFFASFRTASQDKWLHHRLFKAHHILEFGNHLRLQTTLSTHRQDPAAGLVFRRVEDDEEVPALRTTEAAIELRWAPNEEYFQRNLVRSPIVNKYPVFNVRYHVGLKGILGGEYTYHSLRFDANKRWYLSLLGFSDVTFGAGYIFGSVPFPLLDIPTANKSFLIAADSYSLMNDLEFVSDQYLKFSIEHHFEGFFLNKIPLLNRLKIRELAGFKFFYGGLRSENDPAHNTNLFYFPVDANGTATTFGFGRQPYMEASVGLENIFNILRIEYIKRLSYLGHPDIDGGGLRFSVRVGF